MSGYQEQFDGYLTSALSWDQFDALWQALREQADASSWFVYALGQPLPDAAVTAEELRRFLDEMAELLRREHDEDYCGIVYADNLQQPGFVKIYDPNNLGMVCGSSAEPVMPGWTLSLTPPVLVEAMQPPAGRRRWWSRLFG